MAPRKEDNSFMTSSTGRDKAGTAAASSDAMDLAQAYRDLARGEQTATALEANLANLESKVDALLTALESQHANAFPKELDGEGADGEQDQKAASPKTTSNANEEEKK